MKMLRHPNVIRLVEVLTSKTRFVPPWPPHRHSCIFLNWQAFFLSLNLQLEENYFSTFPMQPVFRSLLLSITLSNSSMVLSIAILVEFATGLSAFRIYYLSLLFLLRFVVFLFPGIWSRRISSWTRMEAWRFLTLVCAPSQDRKMGL